MRYEWQQLMQLLFATIFERAECVQFNFLDKNAKNRIGIETQDTREEKRWIDNDKDVIEEFVVVGNVEGFTFQISIRSVNVWPSKAYSNDFMDFKY